MPSKKVNINLSNNLCDIQIYVDPIKQRRAEELIAKTPSIMKLGYELGTRKFGNQLLRIVRKSLMMVYHLLVQKYLGQNIQLLLLRNMEHIPY